MTIRRRRFDIGGYLATTAIVALVVTLASFVIKAPYGDAIRIVSGGVLVCSAAMFYVMEM